MSTNKTGNNNLKALGMLHKALLTGQVVFAAIAFYLVYSGLFESHQKQLEKPLQVIAVILSVGGFLLGNAIFKKIIAVVIEMRANISAKLEAYRKACIVQWCLIETACIFSSIGFMLTDDYSFLCLAGALILTFVMQSPAKIKIVYQLKLSEEEAAEL